MKKRRRYASVRIEWDYIYQLLDAIKDESIRDLAANQIMWHTVRTNRYRLYEHLLNAAILLTPTMTIVLNAFVLGDIWWKQALLIGAGTLTASAKAFSPFHDKRVLYRKCAESLRSETALFVNHAGKYRTSEEAANEIFVKTVIRIARQTNHSWGELEKADSDTQEEQTAHTVPKPSPGKGTSKKTDASGTDRIADETQLPYKSNTNQEKENENV